MCIHYIYIYLYMYMILYLKMAKCWKYMFFSSDWRKRPKSAPATHSDRSLRGRHHLGPFGFLLQPLLQQAAHGQELRRRERAGAHCAGQGLRLRQQGQGAMRGAERLMDPYGVIKHR